MYCEKKGSDCGYLDLMHELKDSLPVERLAHAEDDEQIIGAIEDAANKAIEQSPIVGCSDGFCGVVGYMLIRQVEISARLEKQLESGN